MTSAHQPTPRRHATDDSAPPSAPSKEVPVQSSDLFKGQKTLVIEHNGASYRLQSTKLGKLILTK